jgi:hypothetical protein
MRHRVRAEYDLLQVLFDGAGCSFTYRQILGRCREEGLLPKLQLLLLRWLRGLNGHFMENWGLRLKLAGGGGLRQLARRSRNICNENGMSLRETDPVEMGAVAVMTTFLGENRK